MTQVRLSERCSTKIFLRRHLFFLHPLQPLKRCRLLISTVQSPTGPQDRYHGVRGNAPHRCGIHVSPNHNPEASWGSVRLTQQFSGGLEMLFSDERKHRLSVPARDSKGDAVTVGWLVDYLCEEIMKDNRKEMFVLDGHV